MLSTYDADNNSTPEVLQDICKESGINHLVLLKSSDMDVRVSALGISQTNNQDMVSLTTLFFMTPLT